jgi:hypothetical protein
MTTDVEDFETGNVEHTNEEITVDTLLIKSDVALLDEPVEDTGVQTLSHGTDGPVHLNIDL